MVGCNGYLVGVVYLPLDMLSVGGGGKSSLSIVLYEDVDPLLCDADLASDTV